MRISGRPAAFDRSSTSHFAKAFARCGPKLLLAFLLFFAQQQAVLHLLSHDFDQLAGKQRDTTDPQELVCAKCLSLAHLDHAVSGSVVAVALPDSAPLLVASLPQPGIDAAPFVRYRSRAPPSFS